MRHAAYAGSQPEHKLVEWHTVIGQGKAYHTKQLVKSASFVGMIQQVMI